MPTATAPNLSHNGPAYSTSFSGKILASLLIVNATEACVHHLFFSAEDYAEKGNLIKCNPAIKTKNDQLALQQAIKNDVIDVIATDHASHTWEERQQPFITAPAGLPLIQHALLSLMKHYHNDLFSLELIVQKTSHAPAVLYNVKDRGFNKDNALL